MTAPFQRRRDPQPMGRGWEVAVAVVGGVLLAAALAALAGLGLASLLFGGGWVWPHGSDTAAHVLGGLIAGHPGRGLPAAQARLAATPAAVYGCAAGCELALLAASITGGVLIARYRRPCDARGGMASRAEAKRVLGVSRLRTAKTIIRPDLYGPGAAVNDNRTEAHR